MKAPTIHRLNPFSVSVVFISLNIIVKTLLHTPIVDAISLIIELSFLHHYLVHTTELNIFVLEQM